MPKTPTTKRVPLGNCAGPRPVRLLPMDELQARPCEVDGRPALFHRWVEEDRALLKFDGFVPRPGQQYIHHRFLEECVVPPVCHVDVLRETFALVEYRDGTIAKVDPLLLRFVDREVQSCRECVRFEECEKARHFENYRLEGCVDFKKA